MKRPQRADRRGFSLLEILIVSSMITLVTAVTISIFHRGTLLYRHGETHIELQRSARQLVNRLTPYIGSMFDADQPSARPIDLPANPGEAFATDTLVFCSTEDWFHPDYPSPGVAPSPATSAIAATGVESLGRYGYQVRLLNQPGDRNHGCFVLERLDGPAYEAYRAASPRPNPPILVKAPAIDNTRVLFRPKRGDVIVTDPPGTPVAQRQGPQFSLTSNNPLMADGTLHFSFTLKHGIRGDAPTTVDATEKFEATFNLPKNI